MFAKVTWRAGKYKVAGVIGAAAIECDTMIDVVFTLARADKFNSAPPTGSILVFPHNLNVGDGVGSFGAPFARAVSVIAD